jgi:hypothetical protein
VPRTWQQRFVDSKGVVSQVLGEERSLVRIHSQVGRASVWRESEAIGARRERKHRRFVLLDCQVYIKYQADNVVTEIQAISQNVSIGGFLVKSATMIPEHTPVTFVISMQGEVAVEPVYLRGKGEIVRVEKCQAEGMFAMAVGCKYPITQLEEYRRPT